MTGRLIAVVGPSGVGKDTLMRALAAAEPGLKLVRRAITRAEDAGGEAFDAVSDAEFARRVAGGGFCIHWSAHGLRYGIPEDVRIRVALGERLLVNLSRSVLTETAAAFPDLLVLNLTARPETLTARLAGRGRESAGEIADRLARPGPALPPGVCSVTIANDGPVEEAVAAARAALHPVRA